MRILLITQYFWPEVFRINDLAIHLSSMGHQVTVLTGYPNYPCGTVLADFKVKPQEYSSLNGISIVRVPIIPRGNSKFSLMLNYISFMISASIIGAYKVRRINIDLIFGYAPSPIFSMLPGVLISKLKSRPFTLWLLDLWPDTLNSLGIVKNKALLHAILCVVKFIYNQTSVIYCQSTSFIHSLKQIGVRTDKLRYLPGWVDEAILASEMDDKSIPDIQYSGDFVILWAGNIGTSQDAPNLFKSIYYLRNKDISWVFVGNGRMKNWLESKLRLANLMHRVAFIGHVPIEDVPKYINKADLLITALVANSTFSKTIPARIQTYLGSGKPIVAMIDGESSKIISESGGGIAVPSGDYVAFSEAIEHMHSLPKRSRDEIGKLGREYASIHFNPQKIIAMLNADFIRIIGNE